MNGLYMAAAGMLADRQWLDTIGTNLANADAPGYLAEDTVFQEFPSAVAVRTGPFPAVLGQVAMSVAATNGIENQPQGYVLTGGAHDFAVNGPGFFVVRTGAGLAYTRDGHFHLDAAGHLVDADGDLVLSPQGQPITLGPGPVAVGPNGVLTQNGNVVGQLAVEDLTGPLTALPGDLYQGRAVADTSSTVVGGALNSSGASLTAAAVAMVQAEASYQSLTAMASTESTRLQQTANLALWA
jgi:flagellar basal-body rod protein FlgF